jgi:hypothetical protein
VIILWGVRECWNRGGDHPAQGGAGYCSADELRVFHVWHPRFSQRALRRQANVALNRADRVDPGVAAAVEHGGFRSALSRRSGACGSVARFLETNRSCDGA